MCNLPLELHPCNVFFSYLKWYFVYSHIFIPKSHIHVNFYSINLHNQHYRKIPMFTVCFDTLAISAVYKFWLHRFAQINRNISVLVLSWWNLVIHRRHRNKKPARCPGTPPLTSLCSQEVQAEWFLLHPSPASDELTPECTPFSQVSSTHSHCSD